jgi:ribose transport system permease protein
MTMINAHDRSATDAARPVAPAAEAAPPPVLDVPSPAGTARASWEKRWRTLLAIPELGIALVIAALLLTFFCINSSILRPESFASMMRAMAFIGIIAIGQTLLLIAGELDISVGSVAGLCAIICAYLMKDLGWPVPLAIAAGLGAGAILGLINGVLAVGVGIPAFIVTLGMLYIAKGLTYLICAGYPVYPLPPSINKFGLAAPLGVSWAFWFFLGLAVLFQIMLSRTTWGRAIYATGGNAEVARIAGIRTARVKIACYVATSALAGLSGILLMAQLNVGQPEIGQGWELEVIASTVIGGVSLFGGMGTVTAAVLGLLLMQVVRTGLVISNVNTHWQTVAVGAIMIAAVALDLIRRRARIME